MGLLVMCFLALLYLALPLKYRIIVFLINCFVPDPIPFVDEIFMIVSIFKKILFAEKVSSLFESDD